MPALHYVCKTTLISVVFLLPIGALFIQNWSASFSTKWNVYMKASYSKTLTAAVTSPDIQLMLYVEVPSCLSAKIYWMLLWTSRLHQNISRSNCIMFKINQNIFNNIPVLWIYYRICKNEAGEIDYRDLLGFLDFKQSPPSPAEPTSSQVWCTHINFN